LQTAFSFIVIAPKPQAFAQIPHAMQLSCINGIPPE